MKKLLPMALLLCLSAATSSFTPLQSPVPVNKQAAFAISWPATGTTYGMQGLLTYEVSGSGSTPYSIRFYYQGNQVGGSYPFTQGSPSSDFYATGMQSATGIQNVIFHVASFEPGYVVDFISPY